MKVRRRWSRWRAREADLERELRDHLDLEAEEQQEAGLSPEEAEYAARRALGNTAKIKEDVRTAWGFRWLETLLQDLRYGLRQLRRNPSFTAVAVLTLALGIGANTAIFTVVDSVVLRPLALPHPEHIVGLWEAVENTDWAGSISYPNLKDWQEQNTVFTGISAMLDSEFNFEGKEGPGHVEGVFVSPNFFQVLMVEPKLGRTFAGDEGQPGHNRVVILSDDLWREQFGGDPGIVGRPVLLNNENYTVIGVMAASFRFPRTNVQIWAPLVPDPSWASDRGDQMLAAFARLKPVVNLSDASAQMANIARRLAEEYPKTNKDRTVKVMPLQEFEAGDVRLPLLVLQCAAGFVFLIALVNVTNLLLSRASQRRREFALRTALGARRWRLVCQFLGEGLLLAFSGAALGWLLAVWGVRFLLAIDPHAIPRYQEIRADISVLALTVALSLLAAFVVTAGAALKASRLNVQETLKEGGVGMDKTDGRLLNRLLVCLETGASLMLLIGAGLMVKSLWSLLEVDPGVDVRHVLTMRLAPSPPKYSSQHPAWIFYEPLLKRVRVIPGVRAAGLVTFVPIQRAWCNGDILVEGQAPPAGAKGPWAEYRAVSSGYYRAMGIPLERGRTFTADDDERRRLEIIVNDEFVKEYLGGRDPLGTHVQLGGPPWATIVGVVRDVRQAGLAMSPLPEVDFPYRQAVLVPAWPADFFTQSMSLVLDVSAAPAGIVSAVRSAVKSVDPTQPVFQVETMEQIIADSTSGQRFYAWLLGVFAALAMALAVIGTYGVLAYQVGARTHEIGIRMALGLTRKDVLRLVVGQGLALTLIGIGVGVSGAFALTRFMSSLLYNVRPTDPMTFIAVSLILVVVSLLASYVPARRATKVDPMVALRCE